MYRKPFIDTTEKKEIGFILLFNHSRPECGLKKKKDGAQTITGIMIQYQNKMCFKWTLSGARNVGSFITLFLPNE